MNHTGDRTPDRSDGRSGREGATTVQTNEDLFVVRRRIAADLDRTRLENLVNAVGRSGHRAHRRGWLGRRLIAVGAFLAADATTVDPRTHAAGPPG